MARNSVRDQLARGGKRRAKRSRSSKIWVTLLMCGLLIAGIAAFWNGSAGVESEEAVMPSTEPTPEDAVPATNLDATKERSAQQSDDELQHDAVTNPDGEAALLSGTAASVRQQVDALVVVSGRSEAKYDRGYFGQAWFDEDRNGCDTRNDILGRDIVDPVFKDGTQDCKVLSGTLEDWYSGTTVQFQSGQNTSQLVQIDHIVPLSWAWKHGAEHWNAEIMRAFANDPLNLVATTGQQNQQKSDSGPSNWLPASDAAQCRYVQRFTQILDEYSLGINLRDRAMVRGVLTECDVTEVFGGFALEDQTLGLTR